MKNYFLKFVIETYFMYGKKFEIVIFSLVSYKK